MTIQRLSRDFLLAFGLFLMAACAYGGEGMDGRVGIGGFGGEAVPLAGSRLTQAGDVGTDVGGTLRIGFAPNWAAGFSYENIYMQHNVRREPATLSVLYYHSPDKFWTPVGELGVGAAASEANGTFDNFSVKAGIGAEFFLAKWFSIGPQMNFHYITATGRAPYPAWVMSPTLIAMFYFGGSSEKPAPVAQTPPPATPPVQQLIASVFFGVAPAAATLNAGQSAQFQPQITGLSNPTVHWTIQPPLGTISPNGFYQAPDKVEFAENVTITAISDADGSRTATAIVHLMPPASAPREVSVRMEILFDTAKEDVKAAYDAELQKVADFMKSYPDTMAEIDGHTDSTGDPDFNKTLSQRRADSVRSALISRFGVDGSRLTAVGYGEEKPIANNKTAAGRKLNRRVVAVFKATTLH